MTEPAAHPSRWRISLGTMLALTALVAVWTAQFGNLAAIRRLESRIAAIAPLVPELVATDPTRFAFVRLDAQWMDDDRWDVFVPSGRFRLRLATRDVDDEGLPAAALSAPMPSGRHVLELRQSATGDVRRVAAIVDGVALVAADEPKDWYPGAHTSTATGVGRVEERPADRPLVLIRSRFSTPSTPAAPTFGAVGPVNGVMLWIEPVPPDAQEESGRDASKTPTGRGESPSPTSYLE